MSRDYYKAGAIEAINIIEQYGLNFCLGNVVKYVLRHARKGEPLEDLQKAAWYLEREIRRMECQPTPTPATSANVDSTF